MPLIVSITVLAVGAALIIGLAAINAGRRQDAPEPAPPAVQPPVTPPESEAEEEPPLEDRETIKMRLEITGSPGGASIYLDGHYFGKMPHTTTVHADGREHVVRVAKEGYEAQEKSLVLHPAVAVGRLDFDLVEVQPPEEEEEQPPEVTPVETKPKKKPIKIKIPDADDLYGTKKKVKVPVPDDPYN
jgi:hypothetical protein